MEENWNLDIDSYPKTDGLAADQVCYQGFASAGACDAERLHEDRKIVDGA